MSLYRCPNCHKVLNKVENTYKCENNHSLDISSCVCGSVDNRYIMQPIVYFNTSVFSLPYTLSKSLKLLITTVYLIYRLLE